MELLTTDIQFQDGLYYCEDYPVRNDQELTKQSFSEKWVTLRKESEEDLETAWKFKTQRYLKLYGFEDEDKLASFLQSKKVILDAGCGLGYRTYYFAQKAPDSIVIGMDISDAIHEAVRDYGHLSNIRFIKGDIAHTPIKPGSVDYISCDQVIHHTENPPKTFDHLISLLKKGGEISCYVYAKKALPRELVDDYFRAHTKEYTNEEIWELSEQLTVLGRRLSELKTTFECPDIPILGIKGGEYDIQRFIYWNFLKCFWNEDLGEALSKAGNFDWYSPTSAYRYSKTEFMSWIEKHGLKTKYFHSEEASHSGRFLKE